MMNSASLAFGGSLDAVWSLGTELAFKSTILLSVALAVHVLLKNRLPLVCSGMWNASLLAVLVLPLVVVFGPEWSVLPAFSNHVRQDGLLETNSQSLVEVEVASVTLERETLNRLDSEIPEIRNPIASNDFSIGRAENLSWSQVAKLVILLLVGLSMCVLLMRLFGALRAIHQLKNSAVPVDSPHWLKPFERWTNQLGIRRKVCLVQSADVDVPIVVGSMRPMVVLPASLVDLEGATKIAAIICHETAHVRRHDYEWQMLQRLLQVTYCYQPLIWITDSAITATRERACDEFAIHALGCAQEYIETLMQMAERLATRSRLSLGLAVVRKPQLTRRLDELSASEGSRNCRISRSAMTCLLAIGGLLGSGIACVGIAQEQAAIPNKVSRETRHQVRGMGAVAFVTKAPSKSREFEKNSYEVEIVGPKDQPVTDVEALLYSVSTKEGTYELLRTGIADDRGFLKFDNIIAGDEIAEFEKIPPNSSKRFAQRPGYLLTLRREGFSTVRIYCSAYDLALSGARQTVRLHPAATLQGRVTNPSGEPVVDALVTAGAWAGTLSIEGDNAVLTDSEGRYEFQDLVSFDEAASQLEISNSLNLRTRATAATAKPSDGKENTIDALKAAMVSNLVFSHPEFSVMSISGGDVPGTKDVQLMPAAQLVGRVVQHDTGAAAIGIPIIAVSRQYPREKPARSASPNTVSMHSASTLSDNEGSYRLTNLPVGEYDVWAQSATRNWQEATWVSQGQANIRAQSNQTTQVPDITIGPGGKIRGQLVDYSTGEPLNVRNIRLSVRPHLQVVDGPGMQYGMMQEVPVNGDGTFELRTIPGKVRGLVFVVQGSRKDEYGSGQVVYQSPDYVTRSGPGLEVNHGQSIDKNFRVLSAEAIAELRALSQKAFQLDSEKKYDEAVSVYTQILAEHPGDSSVRYGLARSRFNAGKFSEAREEFETLLKLNSKDPVPTVYLADILATSPVESDRNGERAVKLATSAVGSIRNRHYDERELSWAMRVLAASFAEVGKFDEAIAAQKEAISLAQSKQKEKLQGQLDLYQAKAPYRRKSSPE